MVPATFTDHVFAPFERASSNHLPCGWYLILNAIIILKMAEAYGQSGMLICSSM